MYVCRRGSSISTWKGGRPETNPCSMYPHSVTSLKNACQWVCVGLARFVCDIADWLESSLVSSCHLRNKLNSFHINFILFDTTCNVIWVSVLPDSHSIVSASTVKIISWLAARGILQTWSLASRSISFRRSRRRREIALEPTYSIWPCMSFSTFGSCKPTRIGQTSCTFQISYFWLWERGK